MEITVVESTLFFFLSYFLIYHFIKEIVQTCKQFLGYDTANFHAPTPAQGIEEQALQWGLQSVGGAPVRTPPAVWTTTV